MGTTTHYTTCYRDPKHHECAVKYIEQLHEAISKSIDAIQGGCVTGEVYEILYAAAWRMEK